MSLINSNGFRAYKPFEYPWAYELWLKQQQMHWLPQEVSLGDDIKDWKSNLTDNEKYLLTQIFRFFTQADVEVANCYHKKYMTVFKPTEVQMMLSAFANMETVHIAAYSYLLDTIGMPESEYVEFMKYKEMKDKYDYLHTHSDVSHKWNIAKTLATFGAFTEGVQLFASFIILLNFSRYGKMKGMGQIIAWSVRDETLHVEGITRLYRTLIQENPDIPSKMFTESIVQVCKDIVNQEDAFVDLAFGLGPIQGLTKEEVKLYIRFIANRRLNQIGIASIFPIDTNPIPWVDYILNGKEFTNFFENTPSDYAKSATKGEWGEVNW